MVAKYFGTVPFANLGDKAAVPIAVQPDGSVSYTQGFGPNYELPYANPNSLDVPRDQNNQVLFDMTSAIGIIQLQGSPEWTPAADNGGVSVAYPLGARVRYAVDGFFYISLAAANTTTPGTATWMRDRGFASLQAAAGFQQLPSGILMQWGVLPVIGANNSAQVAYPSAFPTNFYAFAALGGAVAAGAGNGLAGFDRTGGVGSNPLTGCRVYASSASAGTQAGTFIAFGN